MLNPIPDGLNAYLQHILCGDAQAHLHQSVENVAGGRLTWQQYSLTCLGRCIALLRRALCAEMDLLARQPQQISYMMIAQRNVYLQHTRPSYILLACISNSKACSAMFCHCLRHRHISHCTQPHMLQNHGQDAAKATRKLHCTGCDTPVAC